MAQPGPRQNFPSRIVKINFPTGGYIVVVANAVNSKQNGVPPAPLISIDVGGNKDKLRVALIDKDIQTHDNKSPAMSIFTVWNDAIPAPTKDNFYVQIGSGPFGAIFYGMQFLQQNLNGVSTYYEIPHDEWSAYRWTGTFDNQCRPVGPGDYIFESEVKFRCHWVEIVDTHGPVFGDNFRYPGIPDPHNPYYYAGFNGLFSIDQATAYCAGYDEFWNNYKSHLTIAPNWYRCVNVDGSYVDVNQFPLTLHPLEIPLSQSENKSMETRWLFRIPSGLQEQLKIIASGIVKDGSAGLEVWGYSDVKFPFDTNKRQPVLSDFDFDQGDAGPDAIKADSAIGVLPPQDDFPFDESRSGQTFNTGATWTIKTQILPTHDKSEKPKAHYVLINVPDSGSPPPSS